MYVAAEKYEPILLQERPSSAPGRMDGPEDEAVQHEGDVRLDPQYAKFYNSYQGEQQIPPPLSGSKSLLLYLVAIPSSFIW